VVLTLPAWVWTRWYNPNRIHMVSYRTFIPLTTYRKYKGRESLQPRIKALRNMQNDEFGLDLLLDRNIDKIPLRITDSPKFPTYHIKRAKNYCKSCRKRACRFHIRKNGQFLSIFKTGVIFN
jgi:hypothetical protein